MKVFWLVLIPGQARAFVHAGRARKFYDGIGEAARHPVIRVELEDDELVTKSELESRLAALKP